MTTTTPESRHEAHPAPTPVVDPPPPPARPDPPDRVTTHRARTAAEQGEHLGKTVLYFMVASPQNPAIVTPAIVQAVRDTDPITVRLFVCGQGGPELVDDVAQGFAVGQWSLPGATPPPPTLTALDPATAAVGAPSFTLHVRGTGFLPGAVIVFAGHDEPTTLVSSSEVTTGVNMALWVGPDAVPVAVRNADGQVTAEQSFTFTGAALEGTSRGGARKGHEPEPEPDPPNHRRR
jgi:hypothetical protein